jgi:biotin carboxyl carrier protein
MLAEWGYSAGNDSDMQELVAPMPGLVLSVLVSDGDPVDAGQPLLVLEAMKMENELRAEKKATVKSVQVQAGDAVTKAQVLIEFES